MEATTANQPAGIHNAALQRLRAALMQSSVPVQATGPVFRSLLENSLAARPPVPGPRSQGALAPVALRASFAPTPPVSPAQGRIVGGIQPVSQTDVSEYANVAEARRWGGSSCSAAALTAVLRTAGSHARVGDVVRTLEASGGISVAQGLLSRPALVATARRFGLNADDQALSYDQLVDSATRGPVLVDVNNAKFPAGHWMVVTGADAGGVSLADSSGYHTTHMSRVEFQAAWSGRGIRVSLGTAVTPTQESSYA